MVRKVIICLLTFLLLFSSLSLFVSASDYTLYSSVSSGETIVNNLIGLYRNQADYDPYAEYFVCRVGQYDYYLFYSLNLAEDYKYLRYYGTQSGYSVSYHYDTGSGSDLSINNNGFRGVGNIEDSISSDRAESFKYEYVIVVLVVLISVAVLFKVFRKRISLRKDSGWSL